MYCVFCGELQSEASLFCAGCGKPLGKPPDARPPQRSPVESGADAAARRLRESRTTAALHADAQVRQGLRDDAKGWGCMAMLLATWCTIAGIGIVLSSLAAGSANGVIGGLFIGGVGLASVVAWRKAKTETNDWSTPGGHWISRGRTYWMAIKVVLYATVIGAVVVAAMNRDD